MSAGGVVDGGVERRNVQDQSTERILETLVHLGALLSTTANVHETAEQVLDYGSLLTDLPALALYERLDDRSRLRLLAAQGMLADLPLDGPRGIDLAGVELEHGEALATVEQLGCEQLSEVCRAGGFDNAWAAPLVAGETLHGLLLGFDRRRPPASPERLHAFRLLALQASAALENARLHEREREAARLGEILARIDAEVHSGRSFDEVLQTVLAEVTGALACSGAAVSLRGPGGEWRVSHVVGLPDDTLGRTMRDDQERHGARAIESGEVVTVEDASHDPTVNAAHLEAWGVRAVAAVPFRVRTETGGVLFLNFDQPRRFSVDENSFLGRLSSSLSLALQNASRYEDLQRVAVTLQENFLHATPEVPGLEIAVEAQNAAQPELVGGDFHDVFLLPDGELTLLLGDVEGKGVRAAGMTETVRSSARAISLFGPAPANVLDRLNQLLCHDESPLVTLLYAHLDVDTGICFAGSAGHPPPLRIRSDGTAQLLELRSGPPLGAFTDSRYDATLVYLGRGDALVLYTDGVTEARRGADLFGEGRLRDLGGGLAGKPAAEVAGAIRTAVERWADELRDDLHIVVLRLTP